MTWNVQWHSYAEDDIAGLHPQIRGRVLAAIARLSETRHGNVIKLRGRESEWRMRVGDWRVILAFDYPANTFTVMRVRHRGEAYR